MSRIRYSFSHISLLRSVFGRSSPWRLAIGFCATMMSASAFSQNPAPPDRGDDTLPAPQTAPPAKSSLGGRQDLPNKLPDERPSAAELFPAVLPSEHAAPGLDPIEELKAKAAKRKKAAEPLPEEPPVAPPGVAASEAAEFSRRGVATNRALSTGETLLGSFSNVHGTLPSPFLPSVPARAAPFQFGWGKLNVRAGAGVSASRISGTPGGGSDESVLGLVQGALEVASGNSDLAFATSAYEARTGGHTFASLSYAFGYGFPDSGGGQQIGFGSGQTGGFDQQFSVLGYFFLPGLHRLVFGFGLDFTGLSGVNRDVGAVTDRNLATASLTASYELSRKTSFDVEVSMPFRDFSDGVSSRGLNGTFFVRNWVTKKMRLGLGYSHGKLDVEEGADQTFNQGLVQVNYNPTRFLRFNGIGGLDFRELGGSNTATPIFGVGVIWDSTRGSTVSLAAERRIFNAASAINTSFISTSVILTVGQRVWDRLSASFSLGYESAPYESLSDRGDSEQRVDELFTATFGLAFPITEKLGCSLSYTYGKNESDVSPFTSSQATFQAFYAF